MWVFTLVEEHRAVGEAHHYYASYVDREAGKQFALQTLSLVITGIRVAALAGHDYCLEMAAQLEHDGDRLNASTEGDWVGAAAECDGDHKRDRNMTYYLKYMTDTEAGEAQQQLAKQFGEPITSNLPGIRELQPAAKTG